MHISTTDAVAPSLTHIVEEILLPETKYFLIDKELPATAKLRMLRVELSRDAE